LESENNSIVNEKADGEDSARSSVYGVLAAATLMGKIKRNRNRGSTQMIHNTSINT
jgi:hypothetical protein